MSEFDKAQKQGELRGKEQGDYVSSGYAGAAARKTIKYAGMAELADALDSGSSEVTFVQVQVLLPAPNQYNPNHVLVTSEWFGFTFYLNEIT